MAQLVAAPPADHVPARHTAHPSVALSAPDLLANEPGAQLVGLHEAAPPADHVPTGHTHPSVALTAPTFGVYEPGAHAVGLHAEVPPPEYQPAVHFVQRLGLVLKPEPAGQLVTAGGLEDDGGFCACAPGAAASSSSSAAASATSFSSGFMLSESGSLVSV
jgi:hypothetical protein